MSDFDVMIRFIRIGITLGFCCLVMLAIIGIIEAIHIGLGGHYDVQ